MSSLTALASVTGTFLLIAGGSLLAEKVTASGTTMFVTLEDQTTELADGRTMQRMKSKGFVTIQGDQAPRNTTCWSSRILAADGTVESGAGFCHEIDTDGDSVFISLTFEGDNTPWKWLSGAGKFKDGKGEGDSRITKRWDDGSLLVSWEGSWELK